MKTKTFGVSKNKTSFSKLKQSSDDMDDIESSNTFCGYFLEQRPITKLIVPIDTDFKDASHYRMVVNKILELGEQDVVEFWLNSPGGSLDGLVALLNAVANTEAETVAVIQGECHSAASILALSCSTVQVGHLANMLCHSIRYGLSGKGSDVRSQVNHTNAYAEMIFRNAYKDFLDEDEIADVLEGKELWLNYDEINKRLEHKYSILQEQHELEQQKANDCCGDPEGCADICNCPYAEDCDMDD